MKILSPIASGNGAYIIHRLIAENLNNYHLCAYNPWLTTFPPALYAICRQGNPDIIHTTPDYSIFNKRKNTPLVLTFHNYVLDQYMSPYSSTLQRLHYATDLRFLTRKALKNATVLTAVSQFIANLVADDMKVEKKIRVVYNGIDENLFSPRKHARNGKIRVLFSGNLSRRKGANLLPEIASHLNPGIEIIYTTGLRATRKLPDHPALTNTGSIPYSEMPDLYRSTDILLFPSVREGFGLAAAEAMACGLPVVATNCSALPELVDHGRGGLLCAPGDTVAFANSVNRLAASASLRREMGEYNRAKVEKQFTVRRMVQAYNDLFEETLDKR
jgi:glycosyltransferase involved in cell wall biosynthesis